tara:strand:+ start:4238 stop:4510 length:273 start_codon:yes stop_codon:yes gene_type:complete
MNDCCPCCGRPLPIDQAEAEADAIRQWCRNNGVPILLGDCIRREDAARYMGRSAKTLSNWQAVDQPIPVRRLNQRTYYEICDLAAFIASQ